MRRLLAGRTPSWVLLASVVVEAESDMPTYVHVTVIEALVVER